MNSESHDRIRVLLILVPIKSSVYLTDDPVQGCVFATSRIISLLRHEKKALILPSTKKLTVCIEKKPSGSLYVTACHCFRMTCALCKSTRQQTARRLAWRATVRLNVYRKDCLRKSWKQLLPQRSSFTPCTTLNTAGASINVKLLFG